MIHNRARRAWQKQFLPLVLFCLFIAGAGCCYWRPMAFLEQISQKTVVTMEFAMMLLLLIGCASPVQLAVIPGLCFSSGLLTAAMFRISGLPDFYAARSCIQWTLAYLPVFLSSALACMRAAWNGCSGRGGHSEDPSPYFWFSFVLTICGLVLLAFVERFFM